MSIFGNKIKSEFCLAKEYQNFNHGSYGTLARPVYNELINIMKEAEERPDRFFRKTVNLKLNNVRQKLSNFINCSIEDLVLIENASTACNIVLRSYPWKEHDGLLTLSTRYLMVENICHYLVNKHQIDLYDVPIEFPLIGEESKNKILNDVENMIISSNNKIKLACFSHITSNPAALLPIKDLIELCHQYNIKVLIDGAHAIGQVSIDIQDLNPDFYCTNTHKWLYAPKGTALLYVKKEYQNLSLYGNNNIDINLINNDDKEKNNFRIIPHILSNSYPNGFIPSFNYIGTRDYTNFCAVEAAIDYRESIGGEAAIMEYNRNIALRGRDILCEKFNTLPFTSDEYVTSLATLIFPSTNEDEVIEVYERLDHEYDTCIFVYQYPASPIQLLRNTGYEVDIEEDNEIENKNEEKQFIMRISGQLWLEEHDFEILGDNILSLLYDIRSRNN